ncbi:MAG: hypothetical protein IPM78_13220 [Moraxellaceae bacterium]|nr:hypothetical protein [Moraxellaceae bacterium]
MAIFLLQKQLQEQPNNQVNRLALVFALLNADQYQQRVKKLKILRQQAPQRIDFHVIAQVDIELADNQPKTGIKNFTTSFIA